MDQAAAGGLAEAMAKKPKAAARLTSKQLHTLNVVRAHIVANPGCTIGDAIRANNCTHSTYYHATKVEERMAKERGDNKPLTIAGDAEAFEVERRGRPRAAATPAEEWGDDSDDEPKKPRGELGAVQRICKLLEPFDLPARARIATAACVLAKAIRPWREQ